MWPIAAAVAPPPISARSTSATRMPCSGKGQGTCGADNPTTYNHCVKCHGSSGMPQQKASRGSRMRVDSAVMKAEPVMLGSSCPPAARSGLRRRCRLRFPGARPGREREGLPHTGRPTWRWCRCRRASGRTPCPDRARNCGCPRLRMSQGLWSSMWSISAPSAP